MLHRGTSVAGGAGVTSSAWVGHGGASLSSDICLMSFSVEISECLYVRRMIKCSDIKVQ